MVKSHGTGDTTVRGIIVPAALRAGERSHYLVVIAGEKPGQRVRLGGQPVVIGRAEPADLIVNDAQVSRSHCRVRVDNDEVVVEDLESSNGTFIEGNRLQGAGKLPIGARLQLGSCVFEHEWCTRREVEEAQEREHDIEKAGQYIQSLLPKPLVGGALRCDWVLLPSERLGGDAFGYRLLDERHYMIYLIDVSGNGAGAAMHAVSVLNILRRGALPVTDFTNPSNVLETLNVMFEMQFHGGLSFTMWYGVYHPQTHRLKFASAGQHPAFLVHQKRERAIPLATQGPEIGVKRGFKFTTASIDVPANSMLYVFSDGVFDFATKEGDMWGLDNFVSLMLKGPVGRKAESRRLSEEVGKLWTGEKPEDDFSLMAFTLS